MSAADKSPPTNVYGHQLRKNRSGRSKNKKQLVHQVLCHRTPVHILVYAYNSTGNANVKKTIWKFASSPQNTRWGQKNDLHSKVEKAMKAGTLAKRPPEFTSSDWSNAKNTKMAAIQKSLDKLGDFYPVEKGRTRAAILNAMSHLSEDWNDFVAERNQVKFPSEDEKGVIEEARRRRKILADWKAVDELMITFKMDCKAARDQAKAYHEAEKEEKKQKMMEKRKKEKKAFKK